MKFKRACCTNRLVFWIYVVIGHIKQKRLVEKKQKKTFEFSGFYD